MTEKKHWVRIHQPFSIPKQWVTSYAMVNDKPKFTFTEEFSEAGKFTLAETVAIMDELNELAPSCIIAMDGM